MSENRPHLLDSLKKWGMQLWQQAQFRKETTDAFLPQIEKDAANIAQSFQTTGLSIPQLEKHLKEAQALTGIIKQNTQLGFEATRALQSDVGSLEELDELHHRNLAAHLATILNGLIVYIEEDPSLWSYMLTRVNIKRFEEGIEDVPLSRLRQVCDTVNKVLEMRQEYKDYQRSQGKGFDD